MLSRGSRQYMETSAAPQRTLVRATSMATFPPPMTTARPSTGDGSFSATACKKSTAVITPAVSSPGMPALRLSWQPMAT